MTRRRAGNKLQFMMFESGALRSKSIKSVSPEAKLIYLGFLLSPYANYIGCFECPLEDLEAETGLTSDQLNAGILQLVDAGLIEFEYAHEFVRIAGWFYSEMRAKGASEAAKRVRDISAVRVPNQTMLASLVAEFATAMLQVAHEIPSESGDPAKIRRLVDDFVREASTMLDFAVLGERLQQEGQRVSTAVQKDMRSLMTRHIPSAEREVEHHWGAPGVPSGEPVGGTQGQRQDQTKTQTTDKTQLASGAPKPPFSSNQISAASDDKCSERTTRAGPTRATLSSKLALAARPKASD